MRLPVIESEAHKLRLYRWALPALALPGVPLWLAFAGPVAHRLPWFGPALTLVSLTLLALWGLTLRRGRRALSAVDRALIASVYALVLMLASAGVQEAGTLLRRVFQETAGHFFLALLVIMYMVLEPRRALRLGLAMLGGVYLVAGLWSLLHGVPIHPLEGVRGALVLAGTGLTLGFLHLHGYTLRALGQESEQRRQVEEEAARDALTGALNRRAGEEVLGLELEHAAFLGRPFSVILIDLDRFKEVNDQHGHLTGDRALRSLCDCLRGALREEDALIRWGGEEFVVACPATDGSQAVRVAERLRRSVSGIRGTNLPPLSASFGVAEARSGEAVRALLGRADEALYRAKRSGRDRVEAAPLPGGPRSRPAAG